MNGIIDTLVMEIINIRVKHLKRMECDLNGLE